MKNFLKVLFLFVLMVVSAHPASAQIKDGEATVIQGSTTTVSIGAAYQSTLNRATSITYNWSASSSAISIQSKTNKTCTIKGNTAGTAKLNYQCSYYIDGYYRTMNFYYDITIKSNTISVTRVDMSPASATLDIGETIQLSATAYPTNATNRSLNWTTENYSVASVSSNGLVTARGAGRVWIWARATDGSGAGNYCVIDVNEPTKVASIELSETEKTLAVGDSFELTATVMPDDADNKTLKWMSSNEAVAMVTAGVVTALAPGECNIECASTDGSSVSATCHITVSEPDKYWLAVVMPNGNLALDVTGKENINVKITPDDGYMISSVTLDGEALEHDNGEVVLPGLTHNSTLNIVFVADLNAGIDTVDANDESVKVSVFDHTVSIKGAPENQSIYIYNTNGTLVNITTDNAFELPDAGIYILRIGGKSFKLAIQ